MGDAGRRRGAELALVLGVAALGCAAARHFHHDDAYITFRFVERWLAGDGLTWSGGRSVEGFTHPLWLLELAATAHLTGIPTPLAARALGILHLVGIVALFARRMVSPAPAVLLVGAVPVAYWTMGGLETVGFAFWVLACTVATEAALTDPRRSALVGLAGACAVGMRPEGMGVLAVALLWLVARAGPRAAATAALAFAVAWGPWMLFRWIQWGTLVSTSSAAKLEGLGALHALATAVHYLRTCALFVVPVALVSLARLASGPTREALVAVTVALPLLGAILAVGGDHMPHGRFLVPIVTLLAYAGAVSAPKVDLRRLTAVAVGVAALLWLLPRHERDIARESGQAAARVLREHLPPGALVASNGAGAIAWAAPELDFVDMLGLNEPEIARRPVTALRTARQHDPGHRRGDGAHVLGRAPDVIVLGPPEGCSGSAPTSGSCRTSSSCPIRRSASATTRTAG